jgi:hypothetical protein
MFAIKACSMVLLLGAAIGPDPLAQQEPGSSTPQRPDYYSYFEIRIDQSCRILPDQADVQPGKKARPYTDGNICHLEEESTSEHVEQKVAGNQLLRNRVEIQEHTFVLWNSWNTPVTFVVQQIVPKNWTIDSYPPPHQMIGQAASFPVQVQPGKVERLHVGMRRTSPLRATTITTHK